MNNLKILVTGGAGFIGSNLILKIKELYPDSNITVMDNLFTGDHSKVSGVVNRFDVLDTSMIDIIYPQDPGTFDIVYHFGEYSRIVKSFDDIKYVMATNLHGTSKVLESCRNWGAKLIYSASSSTFGNDGQDQNLSPYAWAKAKMVELIQNYREWYGLNYEICYFFNVYGPGQIQSGDYATVVGIFERQYLNDEPLTVVEPGDQTRDFTHVDDIIEGVLKATDCNKNGHWHLRSGESISILDLAGMFEHEYIMIPERKGERFKSEEIETHTREILNWEPKKSLSEYIKLIKNKTYAR
jgi:UDP-glucose 4-epimerase